MKNKDAPCPTNGGTCMGYKVEFKNDDGIWKPVPDSNDSACKIPRDTYRPEIMSIMDMCGYEAAMAVVWSYRACGLLPRALRIVPYEINYDIKAYKREPEEIDSANWAERHLGD